MRIGLYGLEHADDPGQATRERVKLPKMYISENSNLRSWGISSSFCLVLWKQFWYSWFRRWQSLSFRMTSGASCVQMVSVPLQVMYALHAVIIWLVICGKGFNTVLVSRRCLCTHMIGYRHALKRKGFTKRPFQQVLQMLLLLCRTEQGMA